MNDEVGPVVEDSEWLYQCPSSLRLFPASVRHPLRNMVDGVCPRAANPTPTTHRKLTAAQFQVGCLFHFFFTVRLENGVKTQKCIILTKL